MQALAKPSIDPDPQSAQRLSRQLTSRYVASLGALAVLTAAAHFTIHLSLVQLVSDGRVVNLAGRQRMLSQRIAKTVATGPTAAARAELAESIGEFVRVHRGLQTGDPTLGLPGGNSGTVAAAFAELEPSFQKLVAVTTELLKGPPSPAQWSAAAQAIRPHEAAFLTTMDRIVFQLDAEARRGVVYVERLQTAFMFVILLVLFLEAVLVFRPSVVGMHDSVDSLIRVRNALARTEAEQQATLQAIPDGLARMGHDGHLFLLKTSHGGFFGQSATPGTMVDPAALPPPIGAVLASCQAEVRRSRSVSTRQIFIPGAEGEMAFEVRMAPSQGTANVMIVRDITEQRRLEAEVLDATERERTRVGQELHDGLCQHLAGLALLARTHSHVPDHDEFVRLLDDGVTQARELARGLYPATLANLGLEGALGEVVRHVETVSDVHCELTVPEQPIELSNDTALQLFRIAQEAAANAVKHANARNLWIRLQIRDDWLDLEVEDDGRGLPRQGDRGAGLGLDTMAYRARLTNGDFSIATAESEGVVVRCRIPHMRREYTGVLAGTGRTPL